jgi:hypothetical protein
MTMTSRIALAAVLASALAAPALAGDWRYHGGPKAPDSAASYSNDYYAYDYGPLAYGSTYDYAGGAYYGGPVYSGDTRDGPRLRYRYAPATSDYYNRSRQMQGTR